MIIVFIILCMIIIAIQIISYDILVNTLNLTSMTSIILMLFIILVITCSIMQAIQNCFQYYYNMNKLRNNDVAVNVLIKQIVDDIKSTEGIVEIIKSKQKLISIHIARHRLEYGRYSITVRGKSLYTKGMLHGVKITYSGHVTYFRNDNMNNTKYKYALIKSLISIKGIEMVEDMILTKLKQELINIVIDSCNNKYENIIYGEENV